MNLYLIYQNINNGYDTYSDCVVAAENKLEARHTHPRKDVEWKEDKWMQDEDEYEWAVYDWIQPSQVHVRLLGVAAKGVKRGVVCASYHAG